MASSSKPTVGTVEPPHPIISFTKTQWTKPDYTVPTPSLQFLFHLECDMESMRHVGEGPFGDRRVVVFKGGRFEGPKLRGEILPGGADWLIIRNHDDEDGRQQRQTAHLDTRYNLVTHDGATIYIQTKGTRTGPRAVLEKLAEGAEVGPEQYKMRLHVTMETGDARYSWVNSGVFIASSGRVGNQVIYDAYEVL